MPPFDGSETVYPDNLGTKRGDDLSFLALEIVCRMLENPEMKNLWALHHRSRGEENMPAKIAAEIREHKNRMEMRPDLQSFVAEFLLAELRASKSSEIADLRADMAMMREVLPQPEGTGTYKARKAIREQKPDDKAVLDMIDIQMSQKPICHSAGDFGAGYWKHISHDAKEYPKAFASLFVACAGALTFMRTNLGSTRSYIDPNIQATEMDIYGNPVVNPISTTIDKFGCHTHIPFVSAETAQSIGDALGGFGIHCSTIKNLEKGYNFIKIPYDTVMGWFVHNPLSEFGMQSLIESRFGVAYHETGVTLSEYIFKGNTLENFSFHPLIVAVGVIAGWQMSQPCGGNDARETISDAKDFFHRTWNDRPLNYILPVVASVGTYVVQDDVSATAVVLSGAAAGAAGHAVHSLKHAWDRKMHVRKIMDNAKDLLHEFRQAAKEKGVSEAFVEPVRKKWLSTKEKIAWGAASLSAYATIVFMDATGASQMIENDMAREAVLTSSEFLGAATATGMLVGVFLPYNIIEDGLQHVVFGAAGYGIGRACGAVVKNGQSIEPG